jgi:hypothetical protein
MRVVEETPRLLARERKVLREVDRVAVLVEDHLRVLGVVHPERDAVVRLLERGVARVLLVRERFALEIGDRVRQKPWLRRPRLVPGTDVSEVDDCPPHG